jgi:hypothetical protein
VTEVVGSQVSKITPSHHISSLPSPYPRRLLWQGVFYPTEPLLHPLIPRYNPKPSRRGQFRVLDPQPLSPTRICERAAPRPPSLLTSNPTNTHHLPPPSFSMADPKPSHGGSVSGFRPPTPSLAYQREGARAYAQRQLWQQHQKWH